jgi:hypothetical protein
MRLRFLKEKYYMRNFGVPITVILKWLLDNEYMKVWTGKKFYITKPNGRLLRTQ